MQTVVMPKMGDTMEEGKILAWRKKVGDPVARGDSLAEIETDKVNIEAESFAEGVLRKILVLEGESAAVGAPIALVGAPEEALRDDDAAGEQAEGRRHTGQKDSGLHGLAVGRHGAARGGRWHGRSLAGLAPACQGEAPAPLETLRSA